MLEAYFVEGMPVVNSIYDDEGVAVGKTGDGEYSYRSNTDGKDIEHQTYFMFPILRTAKKNVFLKQCHRLKSL